MGPQKIKSEGTPQAKSARAILKAIGHKVGQYGPGSPQNGPRWSQDDPKMAQNGPKMGQVGPKVAPR